MTRLMGVLALLFLLLCSAPPVVSADTGPPELATVGLMTTAGFDFQHTANAAAQATAFDVAHVE